ncbi:MAG: tripartite tricarboxylate transporter permease [Cellvibrionaceae bacterium]
MENINFIVDSLSMALVTIGNPQHILYLMAGVLLGLSVGVFPGLGGIAGLSMLLPFLYGLDPISGLAMMVGLVAVIPTSDTFASVLMGIPGSSASQATVLDGFPLAKKGQAARALAAAFTSSLFGGLLGALILTFFVLMARPLILNFRTPELLMLTLFGFSMVGVLSGKSLLKGLVAVALGVIVGVIGQAPAQGSERLSFGNWYLGDGLQLVIIGLGIFAIPEIIELLRQNRAISKDAKLGAGWIEGIKDWWENRWLSIRCSIIGVIVGVIPGLGGSVVDWISYGHTVQTAKDKSQFGKGDVRGVIGPESSNNAKEGGGLVPTLLFGIPGSGSMAVFLGGMILLGLEAGPAMVANELPTTYTIVWSLALANVFGAGLCLILSPQIAKLTTIRFPLLAPFLFIMIAFACFQAKQSLWDLAALVVIAILGIYMKRFGWPRPAFLIGFVLADQAEVYTYQATQFAQRLGADYLWSPTVGILAVLIVFSVWLGSKQADKMNAPSSDADTPPEPRSKRSQLIFTIILLIFSVIAMIDALSVDILIDKVFPLSVSVISVILTAFLVFQFYKKEGNSKLFYDEELNKDHSVIYGSFQALSWLLLLLFATAIVGFVFGLSIFMLIYLYYRAEVSWSKNITLSVIGVGFVIFLAYILNRDLPPGLLQNYMDLPWPLR